MTKDKKPEKKYAETPLMKQYYAVKAQHPDAIVLFRMGDFFSNLSAATPSRPRASWVSP